MILRLTACGTAEVQSTWVFPTLDLNRHIILQIQRDSALDLPQMHKQMNFKYLQKNYILNMLYKQYPEFKTHTQPYYKLLDLNNDF